MNDARQEPSSAPLGWPRRLTVADLSGTSHPLNITLRLADRVTILTGPNGSGKTRLLVILDGLLRLDWGSLAGQPFGLLSIEFSSGAKLNVVRMTDAEVVRLSVTASRGRRKPLDARFDFVRDPAADLVLPDFIRQLDDEFWEDVRDGELLDLHMLRERFPSRVRGRGNRGPALESDYRALAAEPHLASESLREYLGVGPTPTFVRTQRLDLDDPRNSPDRPLRIRRRRIHEYVNRIQSEVQSARQMYSRISQRVDSQFARKALTRPPNAELPSSRDLELRFDRLAVLHRELHKTGLAPSTPNIDMPEGEVGESDRRFLSVFLEDWQEKLQPFVPVHAKLQMLQDIVGAKLKKKHVQLDESGHMVVLTDDHTPIPVDQLSSGEQHLLALFVMLLFGADPGSVVLIDEPEISLHAVWQHAFLDDIQRVAVSRDLQIVLATHSQSIINDAWELVDQL